jgi:hypothetical protein
VIDKVIIPNEFRRDIEVKYKSTFDEIMYSAVIPMDDVNVLIVGKGQEMK